MELVLEFGRLVRDGVLLIAQSLRNDAAPGLVTIALLVLLAVGIVVFRSTVRRRIAALNWLTKLINGATDGAAFSDTIEQLDSKVRTGATTAEQTRISTAWEEYRETLVAHDEDGAVILRNSARPNIFFNSEDLGFGAGFWRIVPGLFVTGGLFLTFLGLISALQAMDLRQEEIQNSLKGLLTIASAKFIMSLIGLLCSILFTIVLRIGMGRLDFAFHDLSASIEKRLTFISLEALATEQLRATREQREHFRAIGTELVAELGRPLREEIPAAISHSISEAMSPLLKQVGQIGTEGVGTMVRDLSSRFSDDVGKALSLASERLIQAGDRIGQLAERMDQSSGKVGTEMDSVITRLAEAVQDLKIGMGETAETASGAFTEGAEHLLSVMNETLEGIRDNTGEGARAMSAAAGDLRKAASGFCVEIETAARAGSEAATARMDEAGARVSNAIDNAGRGVSGAFERTSAEIGRVAESIIGKASSDLLDPLDRMAEKFGDLVKDITESSTGLRRLADGVRVGADATEKAAGHMRSASQGLVDAVDPIRATNERLESSVRQLSESTHHVANAVSRAAETTTRTAADALASAQEILGGHSKAIEASLAGVSEMLDRLRGQGDRLDDMDRKLGKAFEAYTSHVATAVETLFDHLREMQSQLAPALDTLQTVVDQAEQFAPESRRH